MLLLFMCMILGLPLIDILMIAETSQGFAYNIVDFLLFFFFLVVAVSGALQAAAMASILGLEALGTATGSVYLSSFMSHRY